MGNNIGRRALNNARERNRMPHGFRRSALAVTLTLAGAIGTVVAIVGNLQTVEPFMPAAVRPYLTLIPAVMFVLALLASKQSEAPIDGVLYRENIKHRARIAELEAQIEGLEARLQPRRLSDEQIATISSIVRKGLIDLRQSLTAAEWPQGAVDSPIGIQLVAIENDRETLIYRGDFEKAFQDGGFTVTQAELTGVPNNNASSEFVGRVALLRGKPTNVVRPFVLQALQAAKIGVIEADVLPEHAMSYDHNDHNDRNLQVAVRLVVGQRG